MRSDLRVGADDTQDLFCCRLWQAGRGYRPYFENYTVDASILMSFDPFPVNRVASLSG